MQGSAGGSQAKAQFLQRVQQNQEALEQKSTDRVNAAQEWTIKEVTKLVEAIKRLGAVDKLDPQKRIYIKFGVLFKETTQLFEALSGTLKTAKKWGVVSFGPDVLFERTHDNELIHLNKEEVEPPAVLSPRAVTSPRAITSPRSTGFAPTNENADERCKSCSKRVYKMERQVAGKLVFHKNCFVCVDCSKKLDPKNYCSVAGRVFCKTCYVVEVNKPPSEQRKEAV